MKLLVEQMAHFTAAGAARSNMRVAGWSQELARMQAAGWFHGAALQLSPAQMASPSAVAVHRAAGSAPGVAATKASQAAQSDVALRVPTFSSVVLEARGGSPADIGVREARAGSPNRMNGGTCPTAVPEAPCGSMAVASDASGAPGIPRKAPTIPAREQAGLRVHVENTGQNAVGIWLGMDGDGATVSARAATVLAELRRQMATAGQRMDLVVCNGAVIHLRESHSFKELP